MSARYPLTITAVLVIFAFVSNEDYKDKIAESGHDAKGKSMHDKRRQAKAREWAANKDRVAHVRALQGLADKAEYMTGFKAEMK